MAERLFVPSTHIDDLSPAGRASPDAWIASPADEVWHIAAADEDDEFGERLVAGAIVPFCWVEDLGTVTVAMHPDGTYAVQGVVPPDVTLFWLRDDPETVADSLDEFVATFREMNIGLEEDEPVLVRMNRWSEDLDYRFEVDARGARFVGPLPSGSVA